MKSELEKAERALGVAVDALKSVSQGSCPGWLRTECYDAMEKVAAILNPPPEYEDMPIELWAVVAPSGFVEETFSSEGGAVIAVDLPRYEGHTVARLTGTVRREKVAPVERSVTVDCKINQYGAVHSSSSDLCLLRDYPEFHNSKGSITFTTTDPPK
jgi:hypothetical protein